jgi:hypothetical protein
MIYVNDMILFIIPYLSFNFFSLLHLKLYKIHLNFRILRTTDYFLRCYLFIYVQPFIILKNFSPFLRLFTFSKYTWLDNKVCELATVCLPWQHWTKPLVWFDDVDMSPFHRCVIVDLWQSLSQWHLLLSVCVLVCRREKVGAWIRAANEH